MIKIIEFREKNQIKDLMRDTEEETGRIEEFHQKIQRI